MPVIVTQRKVFRALLNVMLATEVVSDSGVHPVCRPAHVLAGRSCPAPVNEKVTSGGGDGPGGGGPGGGGPGGGGRRSRRRSRRRSATLDAVTRDVALLGPADVRRLCDRLGVRPTKLRGQNFVHDANTVRRIVRLAEVRPGDTVLEVGPGLGSLTLALLEAGARVVAVEIDPVLAAALPQTVAERAPGAVDRLAIVVADALQVGDEPGLVALPGPVPSTLVANLPYNVAVPVVLTLLQRLTSLGDGLVLVQAEVADRLAAGPGEAAYGVPSAKVAWYAQVRRVGAVPRSVFWPVPNVDSGLVRFLRRPPPTTSASREDVFTCVNAAFAQRRKTLRAALAGWAGSSSAAQSILLAAGVDPRTRGERLSVEHFAAIAQARAALVGGSRHA
jgi:16S rRNA (adenine1518-N6/adenine1519-N6)-dimethyltransferase